MTDFIFFPPVAGKRYVIWKCGFTAVKRISAMLSLFRTEINLEQAIARDPLTVTPATPAIEAIARMSAARATCSLLREPDSQERALLTDARASCVLVIENNQLAGIFTERDAARLFAEGRELAEIPISDVMTQPVIAVQQSELSDIFAALHPMQKHGIRHLPVIGDRGQVIGAFTRESLSQLLPPLDVLRLRLVSEVMDSQIICAAPETSLFNVAQLMARHGKSSAVIVEANIPVGTLSDRDLVQLQALGVDFDRQPVGTVMNPAWVAVSPEDTLFSVQNLMQAQQLERAIVTGDRGELLGTLAQTNLLQVLDPMELYRLVDRLQEKVSALEAENRDARATQQAALETQINQIAAQLAEANDRLQQERRERELIEGRLRSSEPKNRSFFEAMSEIVLIIDENKNIEAAPTNPDFLYEENLNLLGLNLEKFYHPDSENLWFSKIDQVIETQKNLVFEYPIEAGDKKVWFEAYIYPGADRSAIWVARNISDRKRIEAQLIKSEAHLSVVQRVARLGSWEYDLKTLKITWSAETFNLFDRPLEKGAPTYEEFREYLHPDDREIVDRTLQEVVENEKPFEADYRLHRRDGSVVFVQSRSALLRDADGEPATLVGTVLDITERKQAEELLRQRERELETAVEELQVIEEELRQQNEELFAVQKTLEFERQRYQDLFSSAPDAYLVTDKRGTILAANQRAEVLLLTTQNQLLQKRLINFVDEPDFATFQNYQNEGVKSGNAQSFEVHLKLSKKLKIPVAMRVTSFRDSQGMKTLRWLVRDITAEKQAEEQLRTLSARLEVAIKSGAIGIWEWDIDRNVLIWDDRMYELYGVQPSQFGGAYAAWLNGVHPDDRAESDAAIQKALRGEREFDTEFRVVHPDGSIHYIKACGLIQRNDRGEPQRAIGINFDISEKKATEIALQHSNEQLAIANAELQTATRLKDEFLANMSHELRTPLNAILGMCEGLLEKVFGSLNERQEKAIATIERSGRHLLELINDILDLSKIESGKLELEMAPVSVKLLCEASLPFVRQQALKKNIQLTASIPDGLPELFADERRIRQVLINLLSNAVKFTPEEGSVRLEVRLEPDRLVLCVIDTGIGISREDAKKLFKPFTQIDSSLNRQQAGTGLGLALVQRIVELHGGSVSLSSEVGKGSCVSVRLPYSQQPSQLHPVALPHASLPADNVEVLVVEDSLTASEQIARYLHEIGLHAVCHSRGDGAIEEAIALQPALIVLDIQLPNLSGWQVLRQLKAHPQTRNIPVLVLSVIDERSQGLALGAADYLVKPISRQQLRAAIAQLRHPDAPPTALVVAPEPAEAQSSRATPLLLLAEDNQSNIDTLSDYLTGRGYRLIFARNGREAIDLAKAEMPDLILMDIQMPGMDGLEAIRRIRGDRQIGDIPIIALTALAMTGDRELCLAAGASDYLTKPVKLKQLAATIQSLLKK